MGQNKLLSFFSGFYHFDVYDVTRKLIMLILVNMDREDQGPMHKYQIQHHGTLQPTLLRKIFYTKQPDKIRVNPPSKQGGGCSPPYSFFPGRSKTLTKVTKGI